MTYDDWTTSYGVKAQSTISKLGTESLSLTPVPLEYKTPVIIDNSGGSSQTDYQVKISLTAANTGFWAHYSVQCSILI
jgi:hypothetical protein